MIRYEVDNSIATKTSKEKYIGKMFKSKKCGKFKVLGCYNRNKHGEMNFVIEFENTGFQKVTAGKNIKQGEIKDPYFPTVCSVGYIGDYEGCARKSHYYQSWLLLLKRCFDEDHVSMHPTYTDATISKDWLCFSTFEKEIKELAGFEYVERYPKVSFQLDKDILFHKNKHYSKETCVWLPQKLNSFFTNINTSNTSGYEGVSPTTYNTFMASLSVNGKTEYLGSYSSKIEAYLVYARRKKEVLVKYLSGEFHFLDDRIKIAMLNKLKSQREEHSLVEIGGEMYFQEDKLIKE